MKNLLLILSCLMILSLQGCIKAQLQKPNSQSNFSVDYSKYRTFALSFDQTANEDTIAMQQAIGREIIYQMNLRGYTEALPSPELIVYFSLHPNKVEVPEFQSYRRAGVTYSMSASHYAVKGVLIVRIFDVKTKSILWTTYVDRLNRYAKWDEKLLRLKVKNIFLYFKEFRKV